jgi:hypothetical protein
MAKQEITICSVGELADCYRIQSWRISRLFELGLVEEPPRVAGRRMIPHSLIPAIEEALRAKGWLPPIKPEGEA